MDGPLFPFVHTNYNKCLSNAQCVDSFVTENPFGAPGGCASTPEPIDGDHDRFTLVWDPPKHDGGSKVTGYQVKDTVTFK